MWEIPLRLWNGFSCQQSQQTINIPSRDPESTALLHSPSSPTVLFVLFWFYNMQQLSAEMEVFSIPNCWRTLSKKAANQSYTFFFLKSVSLLTFFFFFWDFVINSTSESLLYSIKIKLYWKKKKIKKFRSQVPPFTYKKGPTWRSRHSWLFYHHQIWDHTNTIRRFSKRFVSFFALLLFHLPLCSCIHPVIDSPDNTKHYGKITV